MLIQSGGLPSQASAARPLPHGNGVSWKVMDSRSAMSWQSSFFPSYCQRARPRPKFAALSLLCALLLRLWAGIRWLKFKLRCLLCTFVEVCVLLRFSNENLFVLFPGNTLEVAGSGSFSPKPQISWSLLPPIDSKPVCISIWQCFVLPKLHKCIYIFVDRFFQAARTWQATRTKPMITTLGALSRS